MTNNQDAAVHILRTEIEKLVPEEKVIGKGTDELGRLVEPSVMLAMHADAGFNAAREEMEKRINSLDLPALIEEIQKALSVDHSDRCPIFCRLCGEPMPKGEEMFMYHGYSGVCPKPPLKSKPATMEDIIHSAGIDAIKHLPPISKEESNYYENFPDSRS